MIPKRTLTATIEISTGTLTITSVPPTYTGEVCACTVQIDLYNGGTAYSPQAALAEMYFYWPGVQQMSTAAIMAISGSRLTADMTDAMMARSGNPLLIIQLTDEESGDLIVAAAAPISIFETRGGAVIDTRPPSPSEVIYIGRSPYIDPITLHWMQWDVSTREYVDTEVYSAGRSPYVNSGTGTWMVWDAETEAYVDTHIIARGSPAELSATASTLPAGSSATASVSGTPEHPVLNFGIPKGDKGNTGETGAAAGFGTPTATVDSGTGTPSVTVTASGPNTAKVFTFAFRNMRGEKGDTGPTRTVNSQAPDSNGNVVVRDEHISSSAISSQGTVKAGLTYVNTWLESLGLTEVGGQLCHTFG